MQKYMSKSEVRCASLMNNILNENIDVNEILEKIKSFEPCNVRPGVGKIEFTLYVINFVHNKTIEFVNPPVGNETPTNKNLFNVPEVESSTVKRILPHSSSPKKSVTNQEKKTVEIHTLTTKFKKNKITDTNSKDRKSLDVLGSLYAAVIKSNILCNLFHELGYVFTLLTIKDFEIKFSNESFDFNINCFKTNDDCQYFASKTIQALESVIIHLERPIITLILKQKTISTYVPELKKTLECKLDQTNLNDESKITNSSISKDMVKFDEEFDARDCFPTMQMFHGFKSQRDAFYDLLENWKENDTQFPKKSAIILKLLHENDCSINMIKFAKLFVAQLVNSSFEESKNIYKSKTINDLSASKLELLNQRITNRDYTSGHKVNPANEFPGVQGFFKELIIILLSSGIFCKYLIDALVHRIDVLNSMDWASELQEGAIYQQTYFFYVDTLKILAKFLAFTFYQPYKDCNVINPSSKEYVWDIRSKVLPPLNILDKLCSAFNRGHREIVLTTSWVIEYLYQVDQISITTPFYKNVLTWLYSFCMANPVITGSMLMLRLQFNCLLEYINVAPHILFDNSSKIIETSILENTFKEFKIDQLVNTKLIYQYCPQLKNYRSILECKVSNKKIKFVSPIISSTSQKGNPHRLIESELESNFFENHSPSVLITIDFVAKRVASSCTKKIQNKGLAAVKNLFIDIVCEKFNDSITNKTDIEFNVDESDIAKCNVFLNTTIQQYIEHFSKYNIPNSMKELLDSDTVNPVSLPFCIDVTVRKFKALVAEWVKDHINIKNMFINYISTELKTNLKGCILNEDGSNLREILITHHDQQPEELFIPETNLLLDLNILGLKILELDENELFPDELLKYADKFKIILENKNKMKPALYRYFITRLIDQVFLATYHVPKFLNKNVMSAYFPYLAENVYSVSMILCERNIYILSEISNSQKAIVIEKLTAWLEYLIENNFLLLDELTNQIMSILHLSWSDDTLKCLSICFKDLNAVCLKKFDDTKVQELFIWLTHFLDVIEDYNVEI
ncbi:codanin-1 [Sipha flava]|uniref:Codanin-1 n=1 Tax=Sipha flava TaxID=143950 RepID=A0A8B8FXU7_9HEMI|nr:codanin-1 [Sipha flava]XP_025415099.1 codanin-1 [Sipha flava]XP_025415176.1 codanin-1 [Sipha flava]XP_025415246.1 codanin-1 [Sipha flava]XP_025415307.1 codanin-1 [Sipha flava]